MSGYIFFTVRQPTVVQGLPIMHATRSKSDTPHWLRILWMSDQSVLANRTWQNATLTKDRHLCFRMIRTRIPASELPQTHALDRA